MRGDLVERVGFRGAIFYQPANEKRAPLAQFFFHPGVISEFGPIVTGRRSDPRIEPNFGFNDNKLKLYYPRIAMNFSVWATAYY
jgi:hypothetical protein